MIVRLQTDLSVCIVDTRNFRKFSLEIDLPAASIEVARSALANVARKLDAETAWISIEALKQWPELVGQDWWREGLDAMIVAAKPFGWIDEGSQAVRAHIVWRR